MPDLKFSEFSEVIRNHSWFSGKPYYIQTAHSSLRVATKRARPL